MGEQVPAEGASPRTAAVRGWRRTSRRWRGRERGRVRASAVVLLACLLAFHSFVPNTAGDLGSLLETFLPWLGLGVPVLLVAAAVRRSAAALLAPLLPAVVWAALFGGLLLPQGADPAHDITALQHNVSDVNADPEGTARTLRDADPDLIALEEVTGAALPVYRDVLASAYPHHAVRGTVGLWSRLPLSDVRTVDIKPDDVGPGWSRGVRATLGTPRGPVAVYVAHLPSVRVRAARGLDSGWRNESAAALGAALRAERMETVIVLGDLNGTLDDRALDPLTSQTESAGRGFGFSWPAAFPVARIDHVLVRSATVTRLRVLPATGSDHLPVMARIKL